VNRFEMAIITPKSRMCLIAFTLIELLVVIAVIAILASLLLPGLAKARNAADSAVCKSNLRQIAFGLHAYLNDFCSYPPHWQEFMSLASHIGEIFPTNSQNLLISPLWIKVYKSVYQCPGFNRIPSFYAYYNRSSYGWNHFGTDSGLRSDPNIGLGMAGIPGPSQYSLLPIRENQVRQPADMIAVGDSLCFYIDPQFKDVRVGKAVRPGALTFCNLAQPRPSSQGNGWRNSGHSYTFDFVFREDGVYQRRHNERFNILFCDGRVESFRIETLFTTNSDASLARWNNDHQPHWELIQSW